MFTSKFGTLDGNTEVGDRLVAGGIPEGAMVTGARWRFAAGADPTGDGTEWIWKLLQNTPLFTPTWVFDGPSVEVGGLTDDGERLLACVEDARNEAHRFYIADLMGMATIAEGDGHLDAALPRAQGAILWEEASEWLDSVQRYLQA